MDVPGAEPPRPEPPRPEAPLAEPARPEAPLAEPAGAPPSDEPRAQARLPVPPLLADLAGWGWRLLLLGVIGWVVVLVAERLYLVSLTVSAAVLLTSLLSPITRRLRDWGLPAAAATAATAVGGLVVLGGVLTWVVNRAIVEVPTLVHQLAATVQRLPVHGATTNHWRDQIVQELQSHSGTLTQAGLTGLAVGAETVTGVLITLLLTLILLTDGEHIWSWLVSRLPPTARPAMDEAGSHAYARLAGWVRGTFVIALFHGVVVAITLFILRAPLVAPLAVMVFFGSFIPLVGALLFGGIAVLVTFASSGLVGAIVLVVVLLVDNQIEAHVLQPFLVGRYVRLHPFVIAVVIPAGALVGGLAGTLLAVPLTAAGYAALQHLQPPRPPPPVWRGPRQIRMLARRQPRQPRGRGSDSDNTTRGP